MRVTFDIAKKFDLKKIKFDFSKQINLMADSIVKDHKTRLQFGQGVNEKPMARLKGSTIASKRFKNLPKPRVPLYGKGVMLNVYVKKRATRSVPQAIIIPPLKRKEVAKYHQFGTTGPYSIRPKKENGKLGPIFTSRGKMTFRKEVLHPGIAKREWFGITKKQEKRGFRFISLEIDRILNRA